MCDEFYSEKIFIERLWVRYDTDHMVSKIACTSAVDAVKYFDVHLAKGDYFIGIEGEKIELAPTGVWHGKLAAEIGRENQAVTRDDFRSFLECDLAAMGAPWKRPRTSEIKYIEFTYTAPKAFSVVAALDDRLKNELALAVREELTWFESASSARDRRGELASGEVTRATGNMMAALFLHETSRTNDPNMHIHALIGNMTLDHDRGELLAMHYGEMLEFRKTLDARIHNNLASRVSALGYHVEVAEHGFALAEVPREAIDLFSERHKQVEAVKRLLIEGYTPPALEGRIAALNALGQPLSYETIRAGLPAPQGRSMSGFTADQTAVLLTRPEKVEITSLRLKENTLEKLKTAGLAVTVPSPHAGSIESSLSIPQAIEQGITAVFAKDSVVRLDELVGEVVRLAPGAASNEQIAEILRQHPAFVVARLDTPDRPTGVDMVTTKKIILEERQLLGDVKAGLDDWGVPLVTGDYVAPAALGMSSQRVQEIVDSAKNKGEELTPDMAKAWLKQFAGIHRYVSTSTDQFLNIRGGAGVGKTFCMEILVGDSLQAGRQVVIMAPYGEQSRVTLRAESPRLAALGKSDVAKAFGEANTVAHYLLKAENNPEWRATLRGCDLYIDEAGLLDTPTAAALVRLARETGSRIIFQGDTEQKLAVGRGSPMEVLQERLNLGMHVERASISRRQLAAEDKQLAQELSSGDSELFGKALDKYIDRGDVVQLPPEDAVKGAATRILDARSKGEDLLTFASVHRICDAVSDKLHQEAMIRDPKTKTGKLDAWKVKDLQAAELRSPHFYEVGNTIEYQAGKQLRNGIIERIEGATIVLRKQSAFTRRTVPLEKVTALYERTVLERGIGARVIITEKVTHGKTSHERNSIHTIQKIAGGFVTFNSGLKLALNDGRIRQGDVLTVDKAQGAKGKSVLWLEDNRSLMAMSNKRDVHVGFTRHVEKVSMLVENIDIFRQLAARQKTKLHALTLDEHGRDAKWVAHEARVTKNTPQKGISITATALQKSKQSTISKAVQHFDKMIEMAKQFHYSTIAKLLNKEIKIERNPSIKL